ncbi:MAG: acyl carrier protein [Bradymonadaceae bacterium]
MVVEKPTRESTNSRHGQVFELLREAIEAAANFDLPEPVRPEHSLVDDLGFDSLTISVLALEIEERLGQPILLNRWVEGVQEPSELTVASLSSYLEELL